MGTKFCGSTMWKHSPSRERLHRAAAILGDQALHDLTTDDIFWDKIVEITSVGQRDVFEVTVEGSGGVVAQSVLVRAGVQQVTREAWIA